MLTDRRSAQAAALLACCLLLPGCALGYLTQAAGGQLRLMHEREPVERILARPETPAGLRETLEQALVIRDFATVALDLPNNRSYRTYADIHRPYVVWNVVAAPEFTVTPRSWCFPVTGCVAYRGYFSERSAEAYAWRLRERGDDVLVGGVAAYSTLGRFADPLISSMTGYGELELAALVFHELAHQVAYLPGDSSFNEAFAVTVEEEGLARYAAARGEAQQLARWEARQAQRVEVARLFASRRAELADLYASQQSLADKRAQKQGILAALALEIRDLERRSGLPSGYGPWIEAGLNNAHIASVATYYDRVPEFQRLLASKGGDLPAFYAAVRQQVARGIARRHGEQPRSN